MSNLIFDISRKGRCAYSQWPVSDKKVCDDIPANMLRKDTPRLPEVSELQAVRHYTNLSRKNFSIDTHFYPLGSCTMKYNPRGVHKLAMLDGFLGHHPLSLEENSQGMMACLYELQEILKSVTGMKGCALSPMAGAQGEFAGVAMIRAYHRARNDLERDEILVPDAAHGTNPASAVQCGFKVREIPTGADGNVDIEALKAAVFLIGKALGSLVRDHGEHQVVIARDGRVSGPILSKALCDGILSVGCDVVDIGVAPTPVLYYATQIFAEHSGVMLTGSHNPPNYNGLKMVVKGHALAEKDILGLHERIKAQQFYVGLGVRHELDVTERYISQITQGITLKRPLKIIVDAGNGVAGEIAPALYKRMGCEVQELFCEIDGRFPNHHADPSQPENLQDLIQAVKDANADIGLAFDGDADRLGGGDITR